MLPLHDSWEGRHSDDRSCVGFRIPAHRDEAADTNGGETVAVRTQRREAASNGLVAVRQTARQSKSVRFTALLHHITVDLLKRSYLSLERDSAPGIDGVTWQAYGEGLEAKLTDLHDRIHKGRYRARPARRTYIPKADGSQRPLSIWSLEDKIVQQAIVTVLDAIYEEDFVGFSYGSGQGVASTMRWTLSMSAFCGGRWAGCSTRISRASSVRQA